GAELTEAGVVDQDQDDIGCTLGRLHRLWELSRIGVEVSPPHVSGEVKVRSRQNPRRAWLLGDACIGKPVQRYDGRDERYFGGGETQRSSIHRSHTPRSTKFVIQLESGRTSAVSNRALPE